MKLCAVVRETGFAIHRYHKHGHLEKVYENALTHRLRKLGLNVKQQYQLALWDGVVEAGQLLGARGGLDPKAELADFDWDKLACLKTRLCGWSMVRGYVQSPQSHINATSKPPQSVLIAN